MIFAEQVKKQLLSLIVEMATRSIGCFPKILLLETWAFLFHEFNASFTLEKKYNGYQLLVCDGSDFNIACNPEDKDT